MSSDFHAHHKKEFIFKPRGFETWEAHRDHIFSLFSNIPENSLLFYAGDLTLNASDEEALELLNLMSAKFVKVYYMLGNHESNVNRIRATTQFSNIEFYDYLEVILNGKNIAFMHYPIAEWNGKHGGSWHIHGHTHGTRVVGTPRDITCKALDVGIDTHPEHTLWTFSDIREVMSMKN